MSTLRETIVAKIALSEATVAEWKQDLATLEANSVSTLETDVEAIKVWFEAAAKHLGL